MFNSCLELPSIKNASQSCLFETKDLPEIALGVGIGAAIVGIRELGALLLETCYGVPPVHGYQEVIQVFFNIASIPNLIIQVVLKILYIVSVVLIVPWLEEFIFRGVLHDILDSALGQTVSKVLKVVLNGFIFGLCHLSPFAGPLNLPIFVLTFCLGMAFTALRIWREDRVACTAAHMTFNGLSILPLLV